MNDAIELTGMVSALSPDGCGVVKIEEKVFFVPLAVPGQTISFRKTGKKKRAFFGELTEVLEKSPNETPPFDPQFPAHGGAPWQHIDYRTQLAWKERFVKDALIRIGKITDPPLENIVASPVIERYRNKMEFSFGYGAMRIEIAADGSKIWHDEYPGLGLHRRGNWRQIVSVTDTILASEKMMKIRAILEEEALVSGLPVYNPQTNRGFWRHVVVRESTRTGQTLVRIFVRDAKPDAFWHGIVRRLRTEIPGLTGVLATVYDGVSVAPPDAESHILFGKPFYTESFCGLDFCISANAFFQVNTPAAEKLIHTVSEYVGLQSGDHLLDLFCGTGSIGLALAKTGVALSGIEIVPQAIDDARMNAEQNRIGNAVFYAGAVEQVLPGLLSRVHFDAVIVDPPRAGLPKKARNVLSEIPAEKLVLVSCNPATLARDLNELKEFGWHLLRVRPHDLFPHTPHVETVALLGRG